MTQSPVGSRIPLAKIPTITEWEIARLNKPSFSVKTAHTLKDICRAKHGRSWLAVRTGIPEERLLKLANYADLLTIPRLGPDRVKLLIEANVTNVFDLGQRNCDNLFQQLCGMIPYKQLHQAILKAKERPRTFTW